MPPLELYLEELRRWARHLFNIRFQRLCRMAERFGFECIRIKGSHREYRHFRHLCKLPIQPDSNGDAKPYQIRELLKAVELFRLWEDE